MPYELREFTNPCSPRQIKTLPSYADADFFTTRGKVSRPSFNPHTGEVYDDA